MIINIRQKEAFLTHICPGHARVKSGVTGSTIGYAKKVGTHWYALDLHHNQIAVCASREDVCHALAKHAERLYIYA